MNFIGKRVVVASVLVSGVLLTGCATVAGDADGGETCGPVEVPALTLDDLDMPLADKVAAQSSSVVGYDEINREYQDAVANFEYELPEGFAFPENHSSQQPGTQYQTGFGESSPYHEWLDAVHKTALVAHNSGDECESQRLILLTKDWYTSELAQRNTDDLSIISSYQVYVMAPLAGDYSSFEGMLDSSDSP